MRKQVTTAEIRRAIVTSSTWVEVAQKLRCTPKTARKWGSLVPSAQLGSEEGAALTSWIMALLEAGATIEGVAMAAAKSASWVRARLEPGYHPRGNRVCAAKRKKALAACRTVFELRESDWRLKLDECEREAALRAEALKLANGQKSGPALRWEAVDAEELEVLSRRRAAIVEAEWEAVHGAALPSSGRSAAEWSRFVGEEKRCS